MRYGIFSDVHSNLEALLAVINSYSLESIDQYLCVGDIVGYAANPQECIRMINDLSVVTICGNHDWAVSGRLALEYFNPLAKKAISWTAKKLSCTEIDYLKGLPLVYAQDNFVLAHGTLFSPEEFYYLNNLEAAWETFSLLKKQICFVGHTHRPGFMLEDSDRMVFSRFAKLEIKEDKRYIVNVGSVGQPRDGDIRASFAIYDTDRKIIELRSAEYDFKATQKKIVNESTLPVFFAKRLEEGI